MNGKRSGDLFTSEIVSCASTVYLISWTSKFLAMKLMYEKTGNTANISANSGPIDLKGKL